ncbi:MAG: hypothetical protein H0T78_06720 [Longispora sp.]|nr:hypothetical protein [Longispora sp. (in: high G+C Gram-positive bacteria)]
MRRWITAILTTALAASLVGAGSAAQAHKRTHDPDPVGVMESEVVPREVWRHQLSLLPARERLEVMRKNVGWSALGADPGLWQPEELAYLTEDELTQLEHHNNFRLQGDGLATRIEHLKSPATIPVLQNLIDTERASRAITTLAGVGPQGVAGDGGPAISTRLSFPKGVALDAAGNVYVADSDYHRIRKIDTAGIITTIAGDGNGVFAGDGGPATNARLNSPHGVAVETTGTIYIADTLNHRIRKIDTAGIITTIAGNGNGGFAGDGGPATNAQLNSPHEVAVDTTGTIYIADAFNNRIRKIDTAGIITTIAGNGNGVFGGDGGPATNAQLHTPLGVAVDTAANLYVADFGNHRIRKIDAAGVITTHAGDGARGFAGDGGRAVNAQLRFPRAVVVTTAGLLYVADSGNHRIRKIDVGGVITTLAGDGQRGFAGDGGPATAAQLAFPNGMAMDTTGAIYVADVFNHRVRKFRSAR